MKRTLLILCLAIMAYGTSLAEEITLAELFARCRKRYDTITDYQCRLHAWCTKGKKEEDRTINFYFKKPRIIRMDILKGTRPFDNGSVGVFKGGDTVTGHRGGPLSPVGLTLSKHNPLATTIRGVAFDESDIETILEKIPFYIEKGTVTLNVSGKVLELVCKTGYPSENKGISKDIIRIERDSWLPIESERYEEDRLVQKATWKDYIINAGLPDEFFHIRYDPLKLKEMGIKILDREIEH